MALKLVHKWTIHDFSSFYTDPNINNSGHQFVLSENVTSLVDNSKLSNSEIEYRAARQHMGSHRFIYSSNFGPWSETGQDDFKAYLELCPCGFDETSRKYLAVFANFCAFKRTQIEVYLKVCIVDCDGNVQHAKNLTKKFACSSRLGWNDYIELTQLRNNQQKMLFEDKLIISAEVEIKNLLPSLQLTAPALAKNTLESLYFARQAVLMSVAHQWTIVDFEQWLKNANEETRLDSCQFSTSEIDPIKFRLCLHPRQRDDTRKEYLSASFKVLNTSKFDHNGMVFFRISLLDSSGNKAYSRGAKCKITKIERNNWDWPIISKCDLLNPTHKVVTENKLTVYCEVWVVEYNKRAKKPFSESDSKPKYRLSPMLPQGAPRNGQNARFISQSKEQLYRPQNCPIYSAQRHHDEQQERKFIPNSQKPHLPPTNSRYNPKPNLTKMQPMQTRSQTNLYHETSNSSKCQFQRSRANSNSAKPLNGQQLQTVVQGEAVPKSETPQQGINLSGSVMTNVVINAGGSRMHTNDFKMSQTRTNESNNENKLPQEVQGTSNQAQVSKSNTIRLEFDWKIAQFKSKCLRQERQYEFSELYSPKEAPLVEFYLQLDPKFEPKDNSGIKYVAVYLVLHKCNQREVTVNFQVSILHSTGWPRSIKNVTMKRKEKIDIENFAKHAYIFKEADTLMPNDELTLQCKVDLLDYRV